MINSGLAPKVVGGKLVSVTPPARPSCEERRLARLENKKKKEQQPAIELLYSNPTVQDRLVGRSDRVRAGHRSLRTDVPSQRHKPTNRHYQFTGYINQHDAQFTCQYSPDTGMDNITAEYAQSKGRIVAQSDGRVLTISFWKDHQGKVHIQKK